MPLSEQEQRLLEEMERSLYHNDADFVAGASRRHGRPTYAMIVTGVLIGIVGIGTLIAGVALRLPIVGVIGFIMMFAGVLLALTPPRRGSVPRANTTDSATRQGGSFLRNLGERWDNRPDDKEE
jgi:Protein of unknown function (DUF3040)